MQSVGLAPRPASGLEAFRDLERFLSDAAEAHLGLSELERGSERRSRELVRVALQAHVDSRGDGDVGAAITIAGQDGQQVRRAYKRLHARSVLTLFGEVRVTRMGYGSPGHEALHPLDAELCLPERIYSYERQRRLISGAICGPFDEAIALVCEMTGLTVPKRSAEQIVREAAVDFDAFYAERAQAEVKPGRSEILIGRSIARASRWSSPSAPCESCGAGRARRPTRSGWRPFAAVHSQAPLVRTPGEVLDSLFETGERPERPNRPRPTHKRVWASLIADKDTFIADVKAEMTRRDPRHRRTWVIVTDGERATAPRL